MRTARVVVWFCCVIMARAQPAPPPAFEAASVKPVKESTGSSSWDTHPGNIVLRNQTLKSLICIAYHVNQDRVSRGPRWVDSDHFDIIAKAATPVGDDQLLTMLQTLLAERFQLILHHEEKSRTTYALTVAANGREIQTAGDTESPSTDARKGRITAHRISMPKLADTLSRLLNSPVSDSTGKRGYYDVTLEWDATDEEAIFAALQDQLGLKLEDKKLLVDVLVIDRAEKPAEN